MKTWRDTDRSRDPPDEGVDPLDAYLDRIRASHAWRVRFDPRKESAPLPERLRIDTVTTPRGHRVVRVLL